MLKFSKFRAPLCRCSSFIFKLISEEKLCAHMRLSLKTLELLVFHGVNNNFLRK